MKLSNRLQKWRNRDSHSRMYLFGGRLRVSTVVLFIAFVALFWVYETYDVPAQPESPATQVVPPGFVPDPDYTWVPRTNVRTRAPESETTTATTSPTETTGPDDTTEPETPTSPATTLIDPDGPGPQDAQTFTQAPTETSAPSPSADRAPSTTPAEP